MPLYEYQCLSCGVRFERRQRFSDEPEHICPECGGDVQRLVQPIGIVFKGPGFYVTDHRGSSSTSVPGKKDSEERKSTAEKEDSD